MLVLAAGTAALGKGRSLEEPRAALLEVLLSPDADRDIERQAPQLACAMSRASRTACSPGCRHRPVAECVWGRRVARMLSMKPHTLNSSGPGLKGRGPGS